MKIQKKTRIAMYAWSINALVLTVSLFTESYTSHVGRWDHDAWVAMCYGTGFTKVILTILLAAAMIEDTKLNDDKEENK